MEAADVPTHPVLVALHTTSSASDQLRAAVSVEVLDFVSSGHALSPGPLAEFGDGILRLKGQGGQLAGYVDNEVVPGLLSSLLPALSLAGWNTSSLLLAAGELRYSWGSGS
jgi:hypothetical protein